MPRPATRLLIVGWDAADWAVIDPLLAKGAMPVLERLIAGGLRSDLHTLEPKLSPLLWTSVATGKTADRHGILNFVEPRPDGSGLRISSSTTRRCKALWNILSQEGLRTGAVGWYASHPAEPIRGTVVSNMLTEGDPGSATAAWPVPPGLVHPASDADELASCRVRARDFAAEGLKAMLPDLPPGMREDERVHTLAKLMAVAASVERCATRILSRRDCDCTMAFFETIDTAGHHFMQYRPPRMRHVRDRDVSLLGGVMDRVYQWHDAALGRMLEAAGPDTTVMLLSDHGFHSGRHRPHLADLPPERRMEKEASWHRPVGVLVMSGPGIRAGTPPVTASLLDIAPTALALLGLPAARDFDGRVLAESIECAAPPDRIESWESVDGDAGMHPADARQDPFEAADAIRQLVDLGYMAALPEDAQAQVELVRRESAFNLGVCLMSRGRHAEALPHFETLAAARPQERRYAMCLATCLAAVQRHADAVTVLESLLSRDASALEARVLHARCLHHAGRAEDSRREADRAQRECGSDPAACLQVADVLLRQGRTEDALRQFQRAAREDPASVPALLGAARCLLTLQRWEDAAGAALDAMQASKAMPDGHYLLGLALAWMGDQAHAARSIDLGLTFDPRHAPMLQLAAALAALRGAQAEAKAFRERAESARQRDAEFGAPPPLPCDAAAFARAHGIE